MATASSTPSDLPRIEADAGINAVLIRDVPEHMAQYERLIASLDAKPRLVEINLTIIDISTDSLDSLGVDWRLHTTHGDFQYGNANNPPLTFNVGSTEAGQTGSTTPLGLALTASIGGSLRNYLLARINALTQSGNAQLQAKPKVLALDNTEAILENLIHFYVPVSGNGKRLLLHGFSRVYAVEHRARHCAVGDESAQQPLDVLRDRLTP